MKISIAMATYNGAKYIQEQLQSFVDQTRQPDELIITDDCSTDETEAIVREFAKTAPFEVKFYRNKKNLGYCGNFNAALMKTTGDLVFLSDQDDVWFPEKIKCMVEVSESNPSALVIMNDAVLTDGGLNKVGLTKIGQIRSARLSMKSFVMGCCCAIRRELLALCLPIPISYKAHDNWIVEFSDVLNGKLIIEIPMQFYRRHEANKSQFIANRLKKITTKDVLLSKIKSLTNNNFYLDEVVAHREQLHLMIQGLERAASLSSTSYKHLLNNMLYFKRSELEKYDLYILSLEKRIRLMRKSFIQRSYCAPILFFNGGYKNASGIKSMLKDIFIPRKKSNL